MAIMLRQVPRHQTAKTAVRIKKDKFFLIGENHLISTDSRDIV